MRRAILGAVVVTALGAGAGHAADAIQPVGGPWGRPTSRPCPLPPGCLPGPSPYAYPPRTIPGTPGTPTPYRPPGTPTTPPGTPPSTPPGMPPSTPPTTPPATPPSQQPGQTENPFAQPTPGGGESARSFNENFDGDFGGVFYTRTITTGFTTVPRVVGFTQQQVGTTQQVSLSPQGTKVVTNVPVFATVPVVTQSVVPIQQRVQLPLGSRYQGVFITDYDGPRPQNRVYYGYNYYSRLGQGLNPGVGATDMQRQTVGFERTFLGGDASFGMRLPFVRYYGAGGGTQTVGDLSLLGKYAMINNRQTGDVWSAGFVLTNPTGGGGAALIDGTAAPHSWLFQPWTGFIRTMGRGYVLGLSNLIVPSNSGDLMLWGNSFAAGYWLYRQPGDQLLNGIIPAAEVHVRTPLNHRSPDGQVFLQDQVNLTGTVHFQFPRGVLSPAVNVPIVGPRPWSVEAMCYAAFTF